MVRAPFFDRNGMKKGAWSEEEDNKLRTYILRYGHWNWRLLPKYAGLARCGKSCRLRWVNYLKPGVKKGSFTKQEEDLIVELHARLGKKWSAIAAKLPGRTDNDIKNFWHTRIQKRPNQKNPTANIITNPSTTDQLASSEEDHSDQVTSCNDQTGNESASSNNASSSQSNFDQADLWADLFQLADNIDYTQNDYFPPLSDELFSYSELHYSTELSSGYEIESSYAPVEEAGGLYDHFIYYDHGMNLFS